jgi:polysaccharide export outer membrane protein
VFQQPDLTTDARISERGTIAMPLIGEVKLAGMSQAGSQLADVIAAAGGIAAGGADTVTVLRDGKEHKVNVLAKPFKLQGGETINVEPAPVVYVYGEVTRAGAYPVAPNMTVMQVIVAGGGITPRGSERRVKLRRSTGDGKFIETNAKLHDTVKADDVIFVKEALF